MRFFLILAALLGLLYVRTAGGGFPLDDSWIHHVYARNLAYTGQWAFVPGQLSAASTSPLYTVLLALGYKLNIAYQVWPHLLGSLALALCGMFGARLAGRLLPDQRFAPLVTGAAIILSWHLIWAAVSSMETMLFCMWTLALMLLAWRELDDRSPASGPILLRGLCFGTLAALTTLTRPEGLMLAGWVGLLLLVLRPQGLRGTLLWGAGAAIAFAVVIAPYLSFNLQLTGGLLPDTAAAKQAESALVLAQVSYPERFLQMLKPLIAGGQLLLLPGILLYAGQRILRLRQALFELLPLLWAFSLIALYAARLPAPYQHGRYVIPTLPALILVGVVGSFDLLHLAARSMPGRVLTRALAIATVLVFVYFALLSGPSTYKRDVHIINEEMVTTAQWIAANIPPEDLLAVHDIGALGYFAPRPIIDTAGLVSPEVVPYDAGCRRDVGLSASAGRTLPDGPAGSTARQECGRSAPMPRLYYRQPDGPRGWGREYERLPAGMGRHLRYLRCIKSVKSVKLGHERLIEETQRSGSRRAE